MSDYLALLIGIACAAGGGELFVRGTVGTAAAQRISPGIIAATVAAFATSSPSSRWRRQNETARGQSAAILVL